jgi:superoxide dismutase, Fe-Mn family
MNNIKIIKPEFSYSVRGELRPRDLDGISEDQIAQHWQLYEGYVKNVNVLNEHLAELTRKRQFGVVEFQELKRRLGFEYDGMILHEYYFGALKSGQARPDAKLELTKQLKRSFGGFEAWHDQFEAMGKMRGIGWVILYLDPRTKHLNNHWIEEHEHGHPAGYAPILVLDCWEHAYMVDMGAGGRGDYVKAYMRNVDWSAADERLRSHIA